MSCIGLKCLVRIFFQLIMYHSVSFLCSSISMQFFVLTCLSLTSITDGATGLRLDSKDAFLQLVSEYATSVYWYHYDMFMYRGEIQICLFIDLNCSLFSYRSKSLSVKVSGSRQIPEKIFYDKLDNVYV